MLIHKYKNNSSGFDIYKSTHQAGFMIFEVMLAIALTAITFLPIVQVISGLHSFNRVNKNNQRQYQDVRQLITKTIYSDLSTGIFQAGVYRKPQFGDKDCTEFISALGVSQSTNERNLQSSVQLDNFSALDLGVGTTSGITSIRVLNGAIYAGLNSASSSDFDLITIPIQDAEHASSFKNTSDDTNENTRVIKGIDSGPGIIGLAFTGTRVFAVNTSTKSAIQEFVKSASGELALIAEFVIPRTSANTVPIAKSVALTGTYVLVGLEKNTGPELYMYNMETQHILFSLETGYGISVIRIVNNFVYLLGPANPEMDVFKIIYGTEQTGYQSAGSQILLRKIYSYDAPGSSGNGRSIDFLGDLIVFGRSKGNNELDILDTDVSLVNFKVQASVDSIVTGTSTAVLITSDSYKEFQIFGFTFGSMPIATGVTTNGTTAEEYVPKYVHRVGYIDLPARGTDFICIGNSVFIGSADPLHALMRISILSNFAK